jgi:hypothetical protein
VLYPPFPPPPEPPGAPLPVGAGPQPPVPPPPPPVEVIVENIEGDPLPAAELFPAYVVPIPPAPTVIGYDPATFNFVPPGNEVL